MGATVLLARAHAASVVPGLENTQMVEIDRSTDKVVWRYTLGDEDGVGYAVDRISGCDLFGNAAHFGAVTARLSELGF